VSKIALFSFLVLFGCSGAQTIDEAHFWLDVEVQQKTRNREQEVVLPRPPLKFASGSSVSSCEEYFQQSGEFVETAANYSARSHYLVCDALKLTDTWPVQAVNNPFDEKLALCSSVNLASFKHSLHSPVEVENVTLTSWFGSKAQEGLNTCAFRGVDQNFVLNAVLLVKEPNKPQRLWVWVTDEILNSSYRAYLQIWFVFDESSGMWLAADE
jgi:hypothetical protein